MAVAERGGEVELAVSRPPETLNDADLEFDDEMGLLDQYRNPPPAASSTTLAYRSDIEKKRNRLLMLLVIPVLIIIVIWFLTDPSSGFGKKKGHGVPKYTLNQFEPLPTGDSPMP